MVTILNRVRVFVCREACDMRKSFDGLSGAVRGILKQDPLSGHLFVFFNKQRRYVKILYWDTSGYCLWSKRLVRGSFEVTEREEITRTELQQILDGIDLNAKRRKRFLHPPQ